MTKLECDEYIIRIKRHLQTVYLTEVEIKKIAEQFPHCLFSGKAFRAFIKQDMGSLLYWSKTKEGCLEYIKNTYSDAPSVQMIEAHVVGVDLNLLIEYLNAQYLHPSPLINPYAHEEEVLAVKVEEINPTTIQK